MNWQSFIAGSVLTLSAIYGPGLVEDAVSQNNQNQLNQASECSIWMEQSIVQNLVDGGVTNENQINAALKAYNHQ